VTVAHEIAVDGRLVVEEKQHIVYRGHDSGAGSSGGAASAATPKPAQWRKDVPVTSALLFRYSALTFNAHRIHYDHDYCRNEGYSGLLVHGPLQASLLLHFATNLHGTPRRFDFRAVAPLFDDQGLVLNAAEADGGLALWTTDRSGRVTMTATALR
jgi:3-methylfumaryl-CoA hydratase